MFDFWPVYSGERFRASGPSCYDIGLLVVNQPRARSGAWPQYNGNNKTDQGIIFTMT